MAKTIVLDFDGVLHSYTSGWTGEVPTDPPTPGAQEFVQKLIDENYEVVVMTTRAKTPNGCAATVTWLAENGFPEVDVTFTKRPAIAYVDDRAVVFDPFNPDWDKAFEDITAIDDRPQRSKE